MVDDNQTNRRILWEILSNWGLRPTAVADGRDAVAELQRAARSQQPYVLALLDVMMPEMDGFELAARIRQDPALSGLQLMLLSSAGLTDHEDHHPDLDIAQRLLKPVKQSDLWNAITEVLGTASVGEVASKPVADTSPESVAAQHILVVEDGLVNQKVALDILSRRGHTVVVANNGKEALETLSREAFDLVLMDVQMPEMDGLEATVAIRAQEQTTGAHLPIIAMTAEAMSGDRERCLAAGMDHSYVRT